METIYLFLGLIIVAKVAQLIWHIGESSVLYLLRPFEKKVRHKKLTILYEQTKFKLPYYLNEVALYKFALERQTYTLTEQEEFITKHGQACCKCLKAIQDLDNLVHDLELENRYEALTYMEQYKPYSRLVYTKMRMPYFELSHN